MSSILHLLPLIDPIFNGVDPSRSLFGIRIRIHKVAEYGSNLDPDPQYWSAVMLPVPLSRVVSK